MHVRTVGTSKYLKLWAAHDQASRAIRHKKRSALPDAVLMGANYFSIRDKVITVRAVVQEFVQDSFDHIKVLDDCIYLRQDL